MPRPKSATRQYDVLQAICEYKRMNGFSPTIRDLMNRTGITSTSVVDYYLELLEGEKLISRTPGIGRSIEVLGEMAQESKRAHLIYRTYKMERDYRTYYLIRRAHRHAQQVPA